MKIFPFFLFVLLIFLGNPHLAHSTVVEDLLTVYKSQGATEFNPENGKKMWNSPFVDAKTNQTRKCSSCHNQDLKTIGKHIRTGKKIDPLAPLVNPKRLTERKFTEKWFLRNCKWTMGRECTPQEKGDFLIFIQSQ